MKKFHFSLKYAVFIKNENDFLKNSDFGTHGRMTILNNFSKLISERSDQYSRRYGILNSYPFWNSIILYRFYTE